MCPLPTDGDQASPVRGRMEYPMYRGSAGTVPGARFVRRDYNELGHQWCPMIVGSKDGCIRLDGRGIQHIHEHLFDARVLH